MSGLINHFTRSKISKLENDFAEEFRDSDSDSESRDEDTEAQLNKIYERFNRPIKLTPLQESNSYDTGLSLPKGFGKIRRPSSAMGRIPIPKAQIVRTYSNVNSNSSSLRKNSTILRSQSQRLKNFNQLHSSGPMPVLSDAQKILSHQSTSKEVENKSKSIDDIEDGPMLNYIPIQRHNSSIGFSSYRVKSQVKLRNAESGSESNDHLAPKPGIIDHQSRLKSVTTITRKKNLSRQLSFQSQNSLSVNPENQYQNINLQRNRSFSVEQKPNFYQNMQPSNTGYLSPNLLYRKTSRTTVTDTVISEQATSIGSSNGDIPERIELPDNSSEIEGEILPKVPVVGAIAFPNFVKKESLPPKRPPNPSKLSLRRKDLSVRFNTVPEIFYQTHDYKVRLSHSSDDTAHTTPYDQVPEEQEHDEIDNRDNIAFYSPIDTSRTTYSNNQISSRSNSRAPSYHEYDPIYREEMSITRNQPRRLSAMPISQQRVRITNLERSKSVSYTHMSTQTENPVRSGLLTKMAGSVYNLFASCRRLPDV